MTNDLFSSFDLSGLRLPNRLVMAPMSRVRSNPEGLATPSMAAYFAQRATAGLLISDGVQPSLQGQANPLSAGLHNAAQVQAWKQVTGAVHTNGGRIFAQLMHSGRISHEETSGVQPVGPSAVAARNTMIFTPKGLLPAPVPRALSTSEAAAEALVFADAARHAVEAGFDGVELHGANGYLIGQFLSSSANHRTDVYGGSITGRIRFAVEAVAATVDAIGASRVGIRLSPGAGIWDAVEEDIPQMYTALLSELAPLGLAYVHLVASTHEETLIGLRQTWPGALIVNPAGQSAGYWLERGADLVSFGRAFIANPDLVERLRAGLPLATADEETYYTGGDKGYLTYPGHAY
ncbi:alkene reductase [Kineosporia sp. NBRC 101731]|uniref:alkene reductase n=1 Tax=Kineosporia sp. NBRC 101731 TaxID=3032199 RepID=UPI0024A56E84|nr:alkene reductase [Kineosporia sp. NBRC 101731]GLY33339.1 alkene reductase [Kineosporia sp. NBRC 101731]